MGESQIDLLLVEDDAGDALLIQAELKNAVDVTFHVTRTDTLEKACRYVGENKVDIVLLDLRLPDSVGIETLDRLHAVAGQTPILVLTGLEDEELGVRSLQHGAQDYLLKGWAMGGGADDWRSAIRAGTPDFLLRGQLEASSLVRFLRFAVERSRLSASTPLHAPTGSRFGPMAKLLKKRAPGEDSRAGPCIGFLGAKGGSGTSTIATNVAAALYLLGKSPTLVELRSNEGSIATSLRQQPARTIADLLMLPIEKLTSATVKEHLTRTAGGWRVLFSPRVGQVIPGITERQFGALFAALKGLSGPILLDFPFRGVGGLRGPILECDQVWVVTEALPAAVATARKAVDTLANWGVPRRAIGVIALRRYAMTTNLSADDLSTQLGCELVGVIPPAGEACVRAEERGTTLVELEPESAASLTFLEIAGKIGDGAGSRRDAAGGAGE